MTGGFKRYSVDRRDMHVVNFVATHDDVSAYMTSVEFLRGVRHIVTGQRPGWVFIDVAVEIAHA